jgi:hypothetical protein
MNTGINLWKLVFFEQEENMEFLKAMNKRFGSADDSSIEINGAPKFVKELLYGWYRQDTKENGAICCICNQRFQVDKYNEIVCDVCLDSYILYLEHHTEECPHTVYSLMTAMGKTVYIGVTKNPRQRFVDHCKDKDFWVMALNCGFADRKTAEEWELVRIAMERPKFNKAIPEINSIEHLVEKHQALYEREYARGNV